MNRLEACNFIKKETLAWMFSFEFCEISKNTFFTEHLWTTASSRVRAEVGKYALCYSTQAATKRFSSEYPPYDFKRSTVNNWKKKITKDPESRDVQFTKVGKPNKVTLEYRIIVPPPPSDY